MSQAATIVIECRGTNVTIVVPCSQFTLKEVQAIMANTRELLDSLASAVTKLEEHHDALHKQNVELQGKIKDMETEEEAEDAAEILEDEEAEAYRQRAEARIAELEAMPKLSDSEAKELADWIDRVSKLPNDDAPADDTADVPTGE